MFPLFKVTRVTKDRSDVSEALAWDDLTGMRLSADKVIEARNKEQEQVVRPKHRAVNLCP